MGDLINLDKKYVDEMVGHARAEAPNECCGILAGLNGRVVKLYRTTNAKHSPNVYSVNPEELIAIYQEIRNNGWEILGVYHSHTHTEAYPSPRDLKSAFLPQSLYFIISLDDPSRDVVRAFRIIEGKITEVELKVIEA